MHADNDGLEASALPFARAMQRPAPEQSQSSTVQKRRQP